MHGDFYSFAMEPTTTLFRRGLRLELLTSGWNVVGTVVLLTATVSAGSVALAGFGLDSLIEIGASTVVIWQLRGTAGQKRERPALRWIGGAFFALALYVLAQSSRSLFLHAHPMASPLGIVWLALTFLVILTLAAGKEKTGAQLGNTVLQTEARVTRVDAYLAACILVGVALDATLGWWWADPVASLVIVFYGIKEGVHAWGRNGREHPFCSFKRISKPGGCVRMFDSKTRDERPTDEQAAMKVKTSE